MPRAIVFETLNAATPTSSVDSYSDRVMRYIPADVIASWVAVNGVLRGTFPHPGKITLWISFATGILICAIWTYRQVAKTSQETARLQAAVSTAAFAVWVYALGGPFPDWIGWYRPHIGSLLLIAFSLIAGMVTPSTVGMSRGKEHKPGM